MTKQRLRTPKEVLTNRMGKKKKNPIPQIFLDTGGDPTEAETNFLHNIEVLNKLLFSPDAKLRDAAKAINEMLTIVENILLSGFFNEYRKWIGAGGEETMPDRLVQWGEKIHKLITSRGRLVMDMLKQVREDEEGTKETEKEKGGVSFTELFHLPPALSDVGEESGERDSEEDDT